MSRLAVVLVILLVLLAGCSGFTGGNAPEREPYGVEEPVNATVEESEPEDLLPGLTTDGVTNPDALLEAHHEAVSNASYTIETETVYVTETENGTVRQVIEGETNVDSERGVAYEVVSQYTEGNGSEGVLPDRPNQTVERWFGEETLFRAELENGTVEYPYTGRTIDPEEWISSSLLGPLRTVENTTTVGAVEAEDGTYYVVEAHENRTDDGERIVGVDRRDVRTLVREDGLVRQTVSEGVFGEGGDRTTLDSESEVTTVGETEVERPDWYDDAVEAHSEAFEEAAGNDTTKTDGEDAPDESETDDDETAGNESGADGNDEASGDEAGDNEADEESDDAGDD